VGKERKERGEGREGEKRRERERESCVSEGRFLNIREERETFLLPSSFFLSPSFSLDTFTDRSRW
jgi:hypothetical protein